MKKIYLILIIVLVLNGCSLNKPYVTIENSLRDLSEDEFKYINDMNKYTIEDFKYYELKVEGKKLDDVEVREITIPEEELIKHALVEYKPNIWALLKSLSQDNKSEDFFVYEYKFLLNMSEISVDELRDVLDEFEVSIHIKTKDGYEIEEECNLGLDLSIIE
ncbi:hypothetical protein [Vallitalea guaymasensis]|uniref:Uncharacterized protein n=1 Tax=Vallitalea guaymasensis TaxID=1185412 RepID=A0A8J8SB93_9FIRM|nr:hypothetical protein [Vallitalea guaymasensis]QUH28492.1 hypothetical protein HYG85_05945 [Vallitalea guaymasensis]